MARVGKIHHVIQLVEPKEFTYVNIT